MTETDLPTRVFRHRYGRILVNLVLIAFVGYWLQITVRAALPLREPYDKNFPWAMFKDPSAWDRALEAKGKTRDGREIAIPLNEVFRYNRGATSLHIADHARALTKKTEDKNAYRGAKRNFALFLADWMRKRKGIDVVEVTFRQKRVHVDNKKKVKYRDLGSFPTTKLEVDRWRRRGELKWPA